MNQGLTKLPALTTSAKTYTEINLFNNQFKAFPAEIFQMERVEIFNISANKITEIPDEISKLSQLKNIDFGHNKIKEIPESFLIL